VRCRELTQLLWPAILVLTLATARPAHAEAQVFQGDYVGTLGPLHLRLHITAAPDGTLSGTLDSPDQGARGLPCADLRLQGSTFTFTVPSVRGSWQGTVSDAGATLSGTWTQGRAMPLTFTRDTFAAAGKPAPVDGFWLGKLPVGRGESLRIQITVRSNEKGKEFCALDSPDQDAWGLDCANVVFTGAEFAFDVPAVHGHWEGKLSGDGQSLAGTWSQHRPQPLDFQRQPEQLLPPPALKTFYAPAVAPADAAGMEALLARDFAAALERGVLSPATSAGVAIGVQRNGVRRVFAWGTAKPDSIFEIGSITKTFTGLLLAQLVAQGKVRLDEPVRALLPPGTVARPTGPEITVLDLITQHSGLPRMPDNFDPADPGNPYADYNRVRLYEFLARHGVARPQDASFLYSNLGVGLLGQALAERAGTTYAELLREQVTAPLHLDDTVMTLSSGQQARFIQGHRPDYAAAGPWVIDALAGAGALRSTAADMLSYLAANLNPESAATDRSAPARTLAAALRQSQELRADAGPGLKIAFAWLYNPDTHNYWHNGGTGGYSSFAFFNPRDGYAAVVLVNRTVSPRANVADLIGEHIVQRFAGEPAVSFSE
jgi:CubicO group peptidase (beta-lactamase class C family)